MLFIEYPKCTTCQKAKNFLDKNNLKYEDRNIALDNPTKEELKKWIKLSNIDINKFFNTSGLKYRALNLKDKIKIISDDEKITILASDGMLVKRPILVMNNKVLIGFKEIEWQKELISSFYFCKNQLLVA